MTPFGELLRKHRKEKSVTQTQMAKMLGVSNAYLSALENGKKGLPSYQMVHRICGMLNIIWDEADLLMNKAHLSHPKVVVDTIKLSSLATETANLLSKKISKVTEEELEEIKSILKKY